MIRFIGTAALATLPADADFKCDAGLEPGIWFEVANLSPYPFELQDAEGQVRALAGPFAYTAIALSVITQYVRLHAVGTQTSSPLPASAWLVYAGLTKRPMQGLPSIG